MLLPNKTLQNRTNIRFSPVCKSLGYFKIYLQALFWHAGRTLNIFLSTALFSLTTVITSTLQNSCCQAEQQQHFGKVYSSYPYHNDFPIHCPHSSVSRKGNSRNSLCSRHFTRHSSHLHLPDQIKLSPTSKSTVGALLHPGRHFLYPFQISSLIAKHDLSSAKEQCYPPNCHPQPFSNPPQNLHFFHF